MNKYIDAEKLKGEIERLKAPFKKDIEDGVYPTYLCALMDFEDLIASLQQEQPKLPGYNKALLEVKSKVDEIYEETSIGLSEYDSGLYNGIAETCMKLRGFIKARLDSDEQPEVDLEKEIEQYTIGFIGELKCYTDWTPRIARFARYFYGLRNRALEEAARHVYESWMGGTMNGVRNDMVEIGKILNARKEE